MFGGYLTYLLKSPKKLELEKYIWYQPGSKTICSSPQTRVRQTNNTSNFEGFLQPVIFFLSEKVDLLIEIIPAWVVWQTLV